MQVLPLLLLGICAGIFSGFLGIGGATLIIPVFIYIFGLTQHSAQGTALALMIPPIGLLAAWQYWKNGNVNIAIAIWVALGFFIGGFFGAILVNKVDDLLLRRIFGVFLAIVAAKMIISK